VDLSEKCWISGPGKEALELDIARRLFPARLASLGLEGPGEMRLSRPRPAKMLDLHTPPDEQLWPESFECSDSFRYCLANLNQYHTKSELIIGKQRARGA
jgi:hypothetical protein